LKEKKMSRFPSFLEYLNDKGTVVDKPGVEQVPDYKGPDEKSPPNSKVPYKTPVANKAPAKGEKGFAELGDGRLKYEPGTELKYDVKKDVMKEYVNEKGKVVEKAKVDAKADYRGPRATAPKGGKPYVSQAVNPGKKALGDIGDADLRYEPDTDTSKPTKTEGFLNKTKDMSLAEFTKYMLKECGCGQVEGEDMPYVTAYTTGKFQPHPPEVIRYISVLADKNSGVLENLVNQMVSMGYLNKLLKAVFSHPQAYEELTALFGDEDGPSRCKSFAGAMNNSYSKFISDQEGLYESVSSPLGFEDEEDEMDLDGSEEDEEDHHDSESEDEESEDYEGEDLDSDDEEGGDDEDFESEEDEEGSEDAIEDEEGSFDDHDREDNSEKILKKKLKKKFAHDNLLDAMKNHEHMFNKMRG
jgi:hypothetical protein